ncbi:hypothetical protein [Nocardia sp. NBC_01009]|uniref:hypothetical protein n=1 Tax=Nocardia sp. NBC_01009 TaxID=2975996 RepID=UPI003869468E|nr:hypothetical protein OHA42_05385 [Nocardia sp. NBC_01009]
MLLSKTPISFRRRLARVAVAGALVTVPLATLAVTASAETPDPAGTAQVQAVSGEAVQEGTEINGPRGGHDFPDRPGPDRPRAEFRERGDHPGPGNGPHQFNRVLPPTGSAGSS